MPAPRASPFGNGECFLRFEAGRPIVDQRNDFLGTTGAMEVGAVEGPAIRRAKHANHHDNRSGYRKVRLSGSCVDADGPKS